MEMLRFATAGSVDDGKSTLIGRLLLDSKQIFEDQLESVERTSREKGFDYTNLALLTDGLRAEREQGITIDVAYRYFATPRRKFIIADTPGHVQYTRNMVTGASTADLALILVDARHGVVEQSRRHSVIASLLSVRHLVLCVNKMDLVDYDQLVFDQISEDFREWAGKLDIFLVQRDQEALRAKVSGLTVGLHLKPVTYERAMKQGLTFDQRIESKQLEGSLRVVVVDVTSGRIGSVTVPSHALVAAR